MAKIEIIFTQEVLNEMDARNAQYPDGFNNGPVFINVAAGDYGASDGSYCVRSDGVRTAVMPAHPLTISCWFFSTNASGAVWAVR